MKLVLLIVLLVHVILALPSSELLGQHWINFKYNHNKLYGNKAEEIKRFNIFVENLAKIESHNSKYEQGLTSYTMGVNQFADLTGAEFLAYVNKYKFPKTMVSTSTFRASEEVHVPESIDWRESNKVTNVKDQGSCGSCWSFSATGALEGQNAIKTGKLLSLSEQQLVDCSTSYGNAGCGGGWMDYAFQYVTDNGITTEEKYPYEGVDGKCRYESSQSVVKASGFVDIVQGSEKDLKAAVGTVGPIAVAIDASINMQLYQSGYFDDPYCNSFLLNHGVLAIGYGVIDKNQEYWLVKNSWGPSWGESGYIKMARNRGNQCGIATQSSYPKL